MRKFLDVSFHGISLALAVASRLVSLEFLASAHCDRFDGLLFQHLFHKNYRTDTNAHSGRGGNRYVEGDLLTFD